LGEINSATLDQSGAHELEVMNVDLSGDEQWKAQYFFLTIIKQHPVVAKEVIW
jgi:hypothetical protein